MLGHHSMEKRRPARNMEIWILQMTRKKSIIMRMKDGWQNKQPNKQTNIHWTQIENVPLTVKRCLGAKSIHAVVWFCTVIHFSFIRRISTIHMLQAGRWINERINRNVRFACHEALFCFVSYEVRSDVSLAQRRRIEARWCTRHVANSQCPPVQCCSFQLVINSN